MTSQPLVVFAQLPLVIKKLRGKKSLKEVAEGTGLPIEDLVLLEPRPSRRRGTKVIPECAGETPRLDTLDSLLRFYKVSLSSLEALLHEVQTSGRLPADLSRLERMKGPEWCRLAGMVLREARPEDALQFVSRQEIEDHWKELEEHLGLKRDFWRWFLDTRGEPPRNCYGTPFSLTFWYWKSQGLSTWTAGALSAAGLSALQEIEAMPREKLASLRTLGIKGLAKIDELLAARRGE